MRIDKLLAELNMGSRSKLRQDIKNGLVTVNGRTIKDPSVHVDYEQDQITFRGKPVVYEAFHYYMLYKPVGVLSATEDNRQKTVLDCLPETLRKGIFPVGRLDKDAEGLLLLTDDGELAHRLLSPKKHVDKTYVVRVDIPLSEENRLALEQGVDIGEKRKTLPAKVVQSQEDPNTLTVVIHEGKFHQIKRMFQWAGSEVTYLKRVRMGSLVLDEALKPGEWRPLTEDEINELKCLGTMQEDRKDETVVNE